MASTSQTRLILYLIVLLGLVGGFLYNGQFDPRDVVPPIPEEIDLVGLNAFGSLKVNYTVLQNEGYQNLRIFGELPVPTTAPGKANPFQ